VSELAIKEPGEELFNELLIFGGGLVSVLSGGFGWLLLRCVLDRMGLCRRAGLDRVDLWIRKDFQGRWFRWFGFWEFGGFARPPLLFGCEDLEYVLRFRRRNRCSLPCRLCWSPALCAIQ